MIKKIIKTKNGEGYIMICVLILIISMFIAVFLSFTSAVGIIKQTKRNSRIVLDNYIMQTAVENYDSIKNGSDYTEYLDNDTYIYNFSCFNSLDFYENRMYCYGADGETDYYLTKPIMQFIEEKTMKVSVEYTVCIPLRFMGIKITTVSVPVKIVSKLSQKF